MVSLDLKSHKLLPVIQELNILLADYNLYYQNLKCCHWSVVGKNLFNLHENFEQLYTEAKERIDDISERILTLGHYPISKLSQYIQLSSLVETTSMKTDAEIVDTILKDHQLLLKQMRIVMIAARKIKDEGTLDLITGYIILVKESSWRLDAWAKDISEKEKSQNVVTTT